jgi:hypothetical protein
VLPADRIDDLFRAERDDHADDDDADFLEQFAPGMNGLRLVNFHDGPRRYPLLNLISLCGDEKRAYQHGLSLNLFPTSVPLFRRSIVGGFAEVSAKYLWR